MKKNEWKLEELEILKLNYPIGGANACLTLLNRTPFAIRKKAREHKIKRENNSVNYKKYDKEFLSCIVQKSKSYADVVRNLNMTEGGPNYLTIKRIIQQYHLDVSHFESRKELLNRLHKTIPLDEILVKNSSYNRTSLKKRLLSAGMINNICELCDQNDIWHGKKISLILDHINGIHNDNRIENLRMLCPNCNATLDTHCGKNNKLLHKCIDCGKKNSKNCDRCHTCNKRYLKQINDLQFKVSKPSFKTLINEVEELGYVAVGKKYGVSDNAIRKWIKKYLSQ